MPFTLHITGVTYVDAALADIRDHARQQKEESLAFSTCPLPEWDIREGLGSITVTTDTALPLVTLMDRLCDRFTWRTMTITDTTAPPAEWTLNVAFSSKGAQETALEEVARAVHGAQVQTTFQAAPVRLGLAITHTDRDALTALMATLAAMDDTAAISLAQEA